MNFLDNILAKIENFKATGGTMIPDGYEMPEGVYQVDLARFLKEHLAEEIKIEQEVWGDQRKRQGNRRIRPDITIGNRVCIEIKTFRKSDLETDFVEECLEKQRTSNENYRPGDEYPKTEDEMVRYEKGLREREEKNRRDNKRNKEYNLRHIESLYRKERYIERYPLGVILVLFNCGFVKEYPEYKKVIQEYKEAIERGKAYRYFLW